MLKHRTKSEHGQALIMFAVSITVLLGFVALIMDVGWAYYFSEKAQAAVDAAATAAISAALEQTGPGGPVCGGKIGCQYGSCPTDGTNLEVACQYAAANGFANGGDHGRQVITVNAGTDGFAPNVPAVPVDYWVQVTAQATTSQWFSGV